MGQCSSKSAVPYDVASASELGLQQIAVSNTKAFNRGHRLKEESVNGVQGISYLTDYLPPLKTKRQGLVDDQACRLTHFSFALHGNPRGVLCRALLTTKHPRLSKNTPPTMDFVFQDSTKIYVGYHLVPGTEARNGETLWMATSLHFGNQTVSKYRIQWTRSQFPFLVQLFENQTQKTCVSLLTFGRENGQARTMHAFPGNVDSVTKASQQSISQVFALLDEREGVLAFQDALRSDMEKATFCLMMLMRVRLLTFEAES